jgi:hypothetical protein
MPAETTGLRMFPAEKLAVDHRNSADARSQRDHHGVLKSACCARVGLTQQSHSRVIFQVHRQTQSLLAPRLKIYLACIVIFTARAEDPAAIEIHKRGNPNRNAAHFSVRRNTSACQPLERLGQAGQDPRQTSRILDIQGLCRENSVVLDQTASRVTAAKIDAEAFHHLLFPF